MQFKNYLRTIRCLVAGSLRSTGPVLILTLILIGLSTRSASAQTLPFPLEMPLPGVSSYDPEIPTPESVIGHQIGTRHTLPYQVETYFRAVAEASDRVSLSVHGKTYEGRNLIHALVTSPENHGRIDEIKRANQRLSDEPNDVSREQIATMPVVVYQGYSIHGNEASGTEAAMLYLYHLAAGNGPAVEDALDHTVVILDPMFNPDGRDRFGDWANRYRGAVPVSDPQDREHNEGWPGGRSNHYWFDLNRDWLPAQHPESQGRLAVFHDWRPQVLTDHHEMGTGSTFFFQPGIPTRTNPHTPKRTRDLTAAIAEYHAAGLDRIGSSYYSEESFDDFYYGKGSSYPDVHGSLGILFEQASSRALTRESADGILHYAFTVRNQFAASLSTLEAVVALRERLLDSQRLFYSEAPSFAADSDVKAWVISLERASTRAQILAEVLRRHRVEMYILDKNVTIDGTDFKSGEAYVVPIDQPQARFVHAVMEKNQQFEDSLFYDVSTWTLPLAFDVTYGEYRGRDDITSASYHPDGMDEGLVEGGRASYAYLLPWNRYYAPRALYRLMDAGFAVRVAKKPFTVDDGSVLRSFERGTIIIPIRGRAIPGEEQQNNDLHELIEKSALDDHVIYYAVSSGRTATGPDLGGASTSTLSIPRVAILTGTGSSSLPAGEAWHLLSEKFRIPVSLLDMDRVARSDLERYNVIVHPGRSMDDAASDALAAWVRAGGRLIAMPSAVSWLKSVDLLDVTERSQDMDSVFQALNFSERSVARGAQGIGGSIFELELDTTHPLAYGLPKILPVFRQGSTFYDIPENAGDVFGVYSERGILSGYISSEKLEDLPGSAGAFAVRQGQGRVIAFMDRLSFRAFWYGSDRLFLNAVFFGSLF